VADDINYDYASMDSAYEKMKSIASQITGTCEEMTTDAMRLLQSNGGTYAVEYEATEKKLDGDIDALNHEMSTRGQQLNQSFTEMGDTDRRLGAGF
jgi:uncharacterized protein YukE